MKVVKNLISIIMSILIIAGLFTIVPFTAGAETFTSGEYDYELLDDNTAKITRYFGDGGKVEIPSVLDGHTVTAISGYNKYDDEDAYKGAFDDCYFLTSVTIPDSVKIIDKHVFYSCEYLVNVNIGNGVESIGDYAFAWCEKLENVTFGKNIENIGNYAFMSCKKLTNVVLPDGIVSIGCSAFKECQNFTNIVIPDGVGSIEAGVFAGCRNLASVNIPDNVTSIGANAFEDCESLTSVTIPDHVTSIGDTAFIRCRSLAKITIPDSVTKIGYFAFLGSAYYDDDNNWDDGVLYIGHYLVDGNKDNNSQISRSYTVKSGTIAIADQAFYHSSYLTEIVLPDSLYSIGNEAFRACNGLKEIKIPSTVKRIESYTFAECANLTTIKFNNALEDIGEFAFYNCIGLSSIELPVGLKTIGISSFRGCTSLKSIQFPNDLKTIKQYSFEGCTSLKSIVVNAETIESFVFYNCSNLEKIVLQGVKKIKEYAFADCASIKNVYISKKLEKIEKRVFGYHYKYYGGEDRITEVKKIGSTIAFIGEKYPENFSESYSNGVFIYKNLTINKYKKFSDDYNPFPLDINSTQSFLNSQKSHLKNFKSLTPKIAKITKKGSMYFLKNGTYKFTANYDGYKITRVLKPKNSFDPKFSKNKITLKKGIISDLICIKNQVSFIKSKLYYNKKRIKITYPKNEKKKNNKYFYIYGLKKGKTTLKAKVNGVKTLKLKIKVK